MLLRRVSQEPAEPSAAGWEAGDSDLEGNWGLSTVGGGRPTGTPGSESTVPGTKEE